MNQQAKPTKEQIHSYMERRVADHTPPPSMQEIRRQLGWALHDAARQAGMAALLH